MQLWKRPETGIYYAWIKQPHGGTKRVSTKCIKKADAELWAARRERESLDPSHSTANKATTKGAIESFLAGRVRRQRRDETIAFYRVKLGHVLRLFPEMLRDVNASTLESYTDTRREEGAANATIAKEVGAALAMLRYARKLDLWAGDIDKVRPDIPTGYVPRRRALTPWELFGLVNYFCSRKVEGRPWFREEGKAAMIAFMVATGARWGEACRARRDDVKDLQVDIRGTKTKGAARSVPRGIPILESVLRWSLDHADGEMLLFRAWPNVRRDLVNACEAIGIDPVSPNDLRRTFATWLYNAKNDLSHIAKAMGHVDTRMVYRVYGAPKTEELGRLLGARAELTEDTKEATPDVDSTEDLQQSDAAASELFLNCTGDNSGHSEAPLALKESPDSLEIPAILVPRDRIELPTRGFSIPCSTN